MDLFDEIKINNKISPEKDIKIEQFDVTKRFTKPHKHNKYLELVYFMEGEGNHFLDLKSIKIKAPVVFLIQKNQVHHWNITTIPKGYAIIIKESFLERVSDNSVRILLNRLKSIEHIDIAEKEGTLPLLFEALCIEMNQNTINKEVIENGLKTILNKILQFSREEKLIPNDTLDQRFIQLLSEELTNNVATYAFKLHTSSQNLNSQCQKSFNKTASEVIAEFMIKEIKRQLLYTSKNIGDIAFSLNFKDTSNFTKFFKKHTDLTPSQFKNIAK